MIRKKIYSAPLSSEQQLVFGQFVCSGGGVVVSRPSAPYVSVDMDGDVQVKAR